MRYTPEEEYRLTGRLSGDNARDAMEALDSVELTEQGVYGMEEWAPSEVDFGYEIEELQNVLAFCDMDEKARQRIEKVVQFMERKIEENFQRYMDWRAIYAPI